MPPADSRAHCHHDSIALWPPFCAANCCRGRRDTSPVVLLRRYWLSVLARTAFLVEIVIHAMCRRSLTPTNPFCFRYGRQFSAKDRLFSVLTRVSIDMLKENYKDDLSKQDWATVVRLKEMYQIQ